MTTTIVQFHRDKNDAALKTVMEIWREFLGSSTIHGLSYIDKSKSRVGRLVWTLIVCTGFFTAGLLISNSYKHWDEFPVSTSTATHPISKLKFPPVTVCPPAGTNTALNYDMATYNGSVDAHKRKVLEKTAKDIFIMKHHTEYMDSLKPVVNVENIREIYQGFQAVPTHLGNYGFDIKISNSKGRIKTPGFGEKFDPTHCREEGYYHYELEFLEDLAQIIGTTGSLVVTLTVDTRQTEGWTEMVEVKHGPKFEYFDFTNLIWSDALSECETSGGHLASITSEAENAEMLSYFHETLGNDVWFGGFRSEETGNWSWVDGEPWNYENWESEIIEMCASVLGDTGEWTAARCNNNFPYVCEFDKDVEVITGQQVQRFVYTQQNISVNSLHVWWKYKMFSAETEDWGAQMMTGFSLEWQVENKLSDLTWRTERLNGEVSTPDLGGEYDEKFYQMDHRYSFVLNLPKNISETIGNGSLVVNLDVITGEANGWTERVEYVTRSALRYYNTRKQWPEAEAICVATGSHLASVLSQEDMDVLSDLVEGNTVWLGGSDRTGLGDWEWVGGEHWQFSDWQSGKYKPDAKHIKVAAYNGKQWRNYGPKAQFHFVCKPTATIMTGITNQTWVYSEEDLVFNSIKVYWNYLFPGIRSLKIGEIK